ncbi:MAG: MBL fold metallo-hydrolase [Roseburia sp.]|nr:MBL fold metallo-hydrolase [Roseburia sp.]
MEINGICIDSAVVGGVSTNCYIVRREGSSQCVVIDPGDNGKQLAKFIKDSGLVLEDILLTHGHFDHIMGVSDLMSELGGRLCILDKEKELLEDTGLNVSAISGAGAVSLVADVFLKDGQEYESAGMTFTVLHTPGHTGGSCCYYMKEEALLFSGDTLFLESIGRSDLPTGNGNTLIQSLQKKVLTLPDEVKVFPGHGPATTIGYEKENNPYAGGQPGFWG